VVCKFVLVERFTFFNMCTHFLVQVRHAQAVDAAHRCHYNHIAPFHEAVCGSKAELVYFVVDCRVFFNVEITCGNVRFRLVVVVVADKILHCVLREERLKLAVELCGECLVVADDERRPLHRFNNFSHGERFAAASHALERLVLVAVEKTFSKFLYSLRLITCWLIRSNYFEFAHTVTIAIKR